MKHLSAENSADADTETEGITKVSKCGEDGKVGGVIPPPFFPFLTLKDCKDKNDNDGVNMYDNDAVPDHNYRF